MLQKIVLGLGLVVMFGFTGLSIVSAEPDTQAVMAPNLTLTGTLRINQLTEAGTVNLESTPVDLVNVLDISGSMDYCINTVNSCRNTDPNQKLYMAKTAFTQLNNAQQTANGDHIGLVTFPRTENGTTYQYNCQQSGNYLVYMFGENRANLTSDTQSVNTILQNLSANSGTPLADALAVARQAALDPTYHDASHLPVLVIASDGITNVRLNGQWTGFAGSTYNDLACNRPAVQDAIEQANLAKSDLNGDGKPDLLIYTIAIGSDFNSAALQAVSSEPTNRHFFVAYDANALTAIYQQISNQLASEDCLVKQQPKPIANVSVSIHNPASGLTYKTITDANGKFSFDHISLGTWKFGDLSVTENGVTYNVFTDGVGGLPIENPTVVIDGSHLAPTQDLALKTHSFSCAEFPVPTPPPTATPAVCVGAPAVPELDSPADKTVLHKNTVRMTWSFVACAKSYDLQVREDSKTNPNWLSKSVNKTAFTAQNLENHHKYYWRVRACRDSQCSSWAHWWSFDIDKK